MAGRSDDEFRVFVASFADPLARLAFLLTAGTAVDATTATAAALARLGRNWREAQTTGALELLAVDALVARLPHRDRRRHARAAVAPAALPPDVTGADPDSGNDEADVNARARMILWELWQSLSPRDRLPLLLDDPSVAAPRLAGIELQVAAGPPRRVGLVAKRATDKLTREFHTYPSTPGRAALLDEDQLMQLLRDALREHAASAPDQVDPFSLVAHRMRSLRSHSYATTATVGGLLVAGALTAIHVSTPKTPPSATEARLSTPAGTPDPSLLPAAVVDAEAWLRTGGFAASTIVVPLWGGTDMSSTRVVALGLDAAGLAHGLAVDWYHDPGQAGSIDPNLYFSAHYLAPPGAPVPVAFPYATSRIGVVAPRDIAKAALVVNGHPEPQVVLDATGFASLDATSASGGLTRDNLRVDLYNAAGRLVRTLEVAAPAPG